MSGAKTLPRRVVVSEVLSGRYAAGSRPVSWDARREGVESVRTTEGDNIRLFSNGGQSTPNKNWELLLTKENQFAEGEAFSWTLYGVSNSQITD